MHLSLVHILRFFKVIIIVTVLLNLPLYAQSYYSCDYLFEFPKTEPEKVGMSSQKLEIAVDSVNQWIEQDEIFGAVILIIKDGKKVLYDAYGLHDRERNIKMSTDNLFLMRSMTKPLTGTSILMLMEEGKLNLDDPVYKYIPSFDSPESRDITIFQLLTHTSGLSGGIRAYEYESLQKAIDGVGERGPIYPPGTQYRYTDAGSSTLGMIIKNVTGIPPDEFKKKRILEPLCMKDSYIHEVSLDDPLRKRSASRYRRDTETNEWYKYWDNTQPVTMRFYGGGAGGLYSTAKDYAKFLIVMLHQGQYGDIKLLSEETVQMATSPQNDYVYEPEEKKGLERFYGLHWFVYTENWAVGGPVTPGTFGHGGAGGTLGWVDPENNLIALYLTQNRNTPTRREFMRLIQEAIIN